MSVFVTINVGEEVSTNFESIKENNMNLGNISRAKRSGTIMSLCSDIKSKKMPCAINGKYELQEIIAKGGCGTVLKGKEVSSSRFENWCQISKILYAVFTDTIDILWVDQEVAIKIEKANGEDCNTLVQEDAIYNDLHHNGPKLLEGWRQPIHFSNFLAEMRFCCFGSPTTLIVANVRKMPLWMGKYILNSGSIFLFTKFFQNVNKEKCFQNS